VFRRIECVMDNGSSLHKDRRVQSPNAHFLRTLIESAKASPAPFAHSRLLLSVPNKIAPIDEHEAIAAYEKTLRAVAGFLADKPIGTLAAIPGQPMFLCPVVGASIPSHRLVVSVRDGGETPESADWFENLGAYDIRLLNSGVERWLESPDFELRDLEIEIEAAILVVGDALFAASV
jgi:hypothetical protein